MKAEAKAKEAAADAAFAARAIEMDNLKTTLANTSRQALAETNASLAEYQLAQESIFSCSV